MAFTVDDLPPLDPPTPSTAPAVSISGIPQRSPEDERTFFDLADTLRELANEIRDVN